MDGPVQFAAACLRSAATPLLEEEGDVAARASIAETMVLAFDIISSRRRTASSSCDLAAEASVSI